MPTSGPAKPRRKKPDTYHHGDLPRAMLQEAVRTIQTQGTAGLTLRGVGAQLGVSRTALYRHFSDKQALLGAVAGEGFRMLRTGLFEAWDTGGRGRTGFDAMGLAYVRFAVTHPAHYRVMFGGFVGGIEAPGTDAFQVLVDAIVEQQQHGLVRGDEPRQLALYIWSVVHGVAMLALDGMLPAPMNAEVLMTFANERIRTGVAP
jgi:AcrR family transcriptional regulator